MKLLANRGYIEEKETEKEKGLTLSVTLLLSWPCYTRLVFLEKVDECKLLEAFAKDVCWTVLFATCHTDDP